MSEDKKPVGPSQSTKLRTVFQAHFTAFRSTDGRIYGTQSHQPMRALRHGKPSDLVNAACVLYLDRHGTWPNTTACSDLSSYLEAVTTDMREVPLRSHWNGKRLLIDLGDPAWTVVRIDADGARILDPDTAHDLVTFRRSPKTAPMPWSTAATTPDRDRFAELWALVPVCAEDRPVVLALLITSWLGGAAQPIVLLTGPQDAGKTTSGRYLLSLVDPVSHQRGGSLPDSESEWKSRVANARVIFVDNHSHITAKVSDMLCRVSTGGEMSTRQLYTDDGSHTTELLTPVWLTSIDTGVLRGDLASRMVVIELIGLTEATRLDEDTLAERQEAARPAITAQLLQLTSEVIALMPAIDRTGLEHRCTTFATVLRCVDKALGTSTGERMKERGEALAVDVLEADPVAQALRGLLDLETPGGLSVVAGLVADGVTAQKLLKLLEAEAVGDLGPGWPRTPKVLSGHLRRIAPDLHRAWRVKVEFGKSNGARVVRVSQS